MTSLTEFTQLLIATHNQGKLAEIRNILADLPVRVLGISDLPPEVQSKIVEPEEPFDTYQENAEVKARTIAQIANLPTLADDSGLEVTALPGELGVHSKRFAPGSDADRVSALLERLESAQDRSATFTSVLALYLPEKDETLFFTGKINGEIMHQPTGANGFGFDPVFRPNGYELSFAEMSAEEKNKISHRAIALHAFADWVRSMVTDH